MSVRGILAAGFVVVAAAVCVGLGFWQLGRLEQRRELNAAQSAAIELHVLDLTGAGLDSITADPEGHRYRRAVARGRFDHSRDILLRGRAHDGRPGLHLVSPLVLPSGATLLVNRGWIPSPDAATADPRPFHVPREVGVEGILFAVPEAPDQASPLRVAAAADLTVTTYRRLDHATLLDSVGPRIPRLYLQELPGTRLAGDLPVAVPPPRFDEGPHLGYAIQWFSFAAIFVIGFLVVVGMTGRAGGRLRR